MKTKKTTQQRALFATKIGVIATTVGSAVGLGNIWRFPYEAGSNGGGAFMICYFLFIFIIGMPVICAEFIMGKGTRSNIFGAYRKLSPKGKWYVAGFMGIIASILILSFYSVVAGWILEYLYQSVTGSIRMTDLQDYHKEFESFSTSTWRPTLWTLGFLALNFLILIKGVTKGIERMSNILMPMLFVLLLIFCVNSLTLDNASEGLSFLFHPDFSKITPRIMLSAMGQAFFSLSLGLGCMTTYASYFGENTPLGRTAMTTALLDTIVAILAGVIIFPAVFSFGMSPQAGPTLVFEVLPAIFHSMSGGVVWSALFFLLLTLASLTSTISMSEISIAFMVEELKMSRKAATVINTLIAMIFGTLCALSFGILADFKIFGLTIFNFMDYVSSNILLPLGGMIASVFVGWFVDKKFVRNQMTDNGRLHSTLLPVVVFCLKYVAPTGIALVFLNSIGVI